MEIRWQVGDIAELQAALAGGNRVASLILDRISQLRQKETRDLVTQRLEHGDMIRLQSRIQLAETLAGCVPDLLKEARAAASRTEEEE